MIKRFLKQRRKTEALPVQRKQASDGAPDYLQPIVRTVEESWEAPDPDQFDNAYQGYLEELLPPVDQLEGELAEKTDQFRFQMQRMIEIAPDLFEKALRRSAYETGHLIEKGITQ